MKRLISTALFLLTATNLFAGISGQPLYETLLKTSFTNLPLGFASPNISPVTFNEQNKGPVGGVQVEFPADVKTGIVYLIFSDRNATSEYKRKHLPPQIPGEKLLAYPPMARCVSTPNGSGYCDMWIQDYNVIQVAAASNMDKASELMSIGFKHLSNIVEHEPPSTPSGTGICSVLSKQEVESALGQLIREPEPDRVGGCFFGSTSEPGSVMIQSPGTGKTGFDATRAHMAGITAISGIGEDAFGATSIAGFVEIHLLKNNKYIVLIYQNQRDSNRLETAKRLARLIAGRI